MIELVLGNHVNDFSAKELRRDAIEILLSIICLPLRYPTITLEDLEGTVNSNTIYRTFYPRRFSFFFCKRDWVKMAQERIALR